MEEIEFGPRTAPQSYIEAMSVFPPSEAPMLAAAAHAPYAVIPRMVGDPLLLQQNMSRKPSKRSIPDLEVFLVLLPLLASCGPKPEEVRADYEAALAAIRVGDCEAALPLLDRVYEDGEEIALEGETTSLRNLASTYRGACRALAELPGQIQTEPALALEELSQIYHSFKDSTLRPELDDYFARLWEENSIATLASPGVCRRWQPLLENKVPTYFERISPENGADLLKTCADNLAAASEGSREARSYYRTFMTLYPDREASEAVKASFARETLEYIERQPTLFQSIERPQGASADVEGSVLLFANATGNPMEVMVAGNDDVIVERIEPCKDCEEQNDPCSGQTPRLTKLLGPGKYQIVVEVETDTDRLAQQFGFGFRDPQIRSYIGTWELAAGTAYPQCFYISTTADRF